MAVSTLQQATCLMAGADLWVIPEPEKLRIFNRLDWYVNFQLTKSLAKSVKKLSESQQEWLEKFNLPYLNLSDTPARLMISSSRHLPNRWIVQVENSKTIKTWVAGVHQLWLDLKKPSLRVFLPRGLSADHFVNSWTEIESFDDFSLVID